MLHAPLENTVIGDVNRSKFGCTHVNDLIKKCCTLCSSYRLVQHFFWDVFRRATLRATFYVSDDDIFVKYVCNIYYHRGVFNSIFWKYRHDPCNIDGTVKILDEKNVQHWPFRSKISFNIFRITSHIVQHWRKEIFHIHTKFFEK